MRVAFNQDSSCVVTGTSHGFRVYNCSPFGRFFASSEHEGAVGIAEMLFSTSLVVLVGNGETPNQSPRRLRVVNTRRHDANYVLCELTFPTSVLRIRLNRQRLVVVLEAQIYIYNIANMRLLHTLDTVANKDGVADITPEPSTTGANYLVYPAGPPTKHNLSTSANAAEVPKPPQGELVVFDLESLSPLNIVRAHRSPLAQVAMNEDGTLVATTSDKGTIVRVFAVPSGNMLYEFRRGTYHSRVFSLAFSLDSKLLCVSSATQTVHIYKLDDESRVRVPSKYGEVDPDADAASEASADAREPRDARDIREESPRPSPKSKKHWLLRKAWEPAPGSRDFAYFRLPIRPGTRSVLGMAPLTNIVYVATESGKLYHYSVDLERGGECERIAEFSLD